MDEEHSQLPINPYGRSKLIVEQMLGDLDHYSGFRSVVLRYFNAAGADPEGRIGEWHEPETHAIPLAIEAALGRRVGFKVFGSDYETRDGTCIRDFVHVMDLADAHSRAVQYLLDGGDSVALNLGTGDGTTVKEFLATIERVSGRQFAVDYVQRREGDSPVLVADNAKAKAVLGWAPSMISPRSSKPPGSGIRVPIWGIRRMPTRASPVPLDNLPSPEASCLICGARDLHLVGLAARGQGGEGYRSIRSANAARTYNAVVTVPPLGHYQMTLRCTWASFAGGSSSGLSLWHARANSREMEACDDTTLVSAMAAGRHRIA